ncbi:hypothetical protein DFH28DRAFT_1089609 [Melampsora americana]|nr:hypothetical protein DFH28DRAFT_1089609 [Melampsora americana]
MNQENQDALEEVRTILMRTDPNGLEDQLTSLDLDSNSIPIPPESSSSSSSPSPSPSLSMFLESTNDQVKLTEVERSRLNLSIPIIRLCRILSLRLVNPSPSNLNLLKSIKLEELEKMVNLIERFSSHIDELISELDSSPHSKSSITKVLNRLSLDCDGLILSLKNGNGDEDRLDSKEIKWFDIWTDQMKNASNSLLQEFD